MYLFRGSPVLGGSGEEDSALALTRRSNENIAVTVRSSSAEWNGEPADLMVISRVANGEVQPSREDRVHELEAILDTATDGVIVLNETGRILSLNRSAEALFGYDERDVAGDAITVLLAPESHMVALDYLEGCARRVSHACSTMDARCSVGNARAARSRCS
ncbi:PAS domain-containing protein [Microvirga aerilata]|uniref:PAS domain-containing protein n=1 Tax=Microvirga aerilata TaxID=670292 RepID=UPI00362D6892